MARHEAFQKAGHDEDGHQADGQLQPLAGGVAEGFGPAESARKQQAPRQHEARAAGQHDGRYFQCAVNPDRKQRRLERALRVEKILKRPQHHPIPEQHKERAPARRDAGGEGEQGHAHVVEGDEQEHGRFVLAFINGHRVAAPNVFQGAVHVGVAEHHAHKRVVVGCRQRAHQREQAEHERRQQQRPAVAGHHQRQLRDPELPDAAPAFLFVFIQPLVQLPGQGVEVGRGGRGRVKRLGVGQIVSQGHEAGGQLVGGGRGLGFVVAPARLVLPQKKGFAHGGNGQMGEWTNAGRKYKAAPWEARRRRRGQIPFR